MIRDRLCEENLPLPFSNALLSTAAGSDSNVRHAREGVDPRAMCILHNHAVKRIDQESPGPVLITSEDDERGERRSHLEYSLRTMVARESLLRA
jgi:hypothetical protein